MTKIKSIKRKSSKIETVPEVLPPPKKRSSDEPIPRKENWTNKQRVLVVATRGINHRDRHLMQDIKTLMPHHNPEFKMERGKDFSVVNEMCDMKHCNKGIIFEGRRKRDLYMWMSNVPAGPSVKFLVENVYTMAELKMTGNCLRGSRPLLSFDTTFSTQKHYKLLKQLLQQTFGVPNHHPRSQPFFDHVYTFTILDNRIWFRNFQILSEDGALAEIGPRFVLNPVKIFADSFGGLTLWENSKYISPSHYRKMKNNQNKKSAIRDVRRTVHPTNVYDLDPLDNIFQEDSLALASALENA